MTRDQMVAAQVRARCRADGGPLQVVRAMTPSGAAYQSEALAPIDARHVAFELRFNRFTDVEIVGDREWA